MNDHIVSFSKGAYFPLSYLTDMLGYFRNNRDRYSIITYADLLWEDDYDYKNGYPEEKKRWLHGIKTGLIDNNKAYVLIQYDMDSCPERTMAVLSHKSHSCIPATITRFLKRVNRRLFKYKNILEYTDYNIDLELLNRLTKHQFLIAYHSNCYERSGHNEILAKEILKDDIEELRKYHDIEYYTAHGGVPCKAGKNNKDIEPSDQESLKVRWVHNGATPYFDSSFSDGGHNSPYRDPKNRDIRDFVARMMPGGRYRILLHPQYYDIEYRHSDRYAGTAWYDSLVQGYRKCPNYNSWSSVTSSCNIKKKVYIISRIKTFFEKTIKT